MQVCVLTVSSNNKNLSKIATAMAKGIEANSHIVKILDMTKDVEKLTFYDYIVIIANSTTAFGGKVHPNLAKYLGQAGQVSGKRSAAFITSNCISKRKTLSSLMRVMESEGMLIKYFNVIKNESAASYYGKVLKIERNL